jgi:hypothetical protein
VKAALITFLFLFSIASGYSQTQERKLMDRVMKPDMALENPMQARSFSESGGVKIKKSEKGNLQFFGVKEAETKDFVTRSFLGLKNPWFGNKVFETKKDPMLKGYDVKKWRTKDNRSPEIPNYAKSGKEANYFGSPVVPLQTYTPVPAAGGGVSKISDKINEKMTIDEVRELLNKPR